MIKNRTQKVNMSKLNFLFRKRELTPAQKIENERINKPIYKLFFGLTNKARPTVERKDIRITAIFIRFTIAS
jgi:hypothetical protein